MQQAINTTPWAHTHVVLKILILILIQEHMK